MENRLPYFGCEIDLAGAYMGLSNVLMEQNKLVEAEANCKRALELYKMKMPPNHPYIAGMF